jgi:hypothetical protein
MDVKAAIRKFLSAARLRLVLLVAALVAAPGPSSVADAKSWLL